MNTLPKGLRELDEDEFPHRELSGRAIACFNRVFDELGYGFAESIYRRSLAIELASRGMRVEQEVVIDVVYRGVEVGRHRLDLVIDRTLVAEIKTGPGSIDQSTKAQVLNYLRAADVQVGLILHFGHSPTPKRVLNPYWHSMKGTNRL